MLRVKVLKTTGRDAEELEDLFEQWAEAVSEEYAVAIKQMDYRIEGGEEYAATYYLFIVYDEQKLPEGDGPGNMVYGKFKEVD
jgi:hypothetical protein